ncbi:hypothetical protein HG535_0E05670 [Zygotorulaspora mrakii]|uniref:RNase III domain-containing protein n=1 Tax=Zygotorulaspora mrakii TaxID=42260 RepID=A0A7H9B4U2_ZYGMR|nr:uncharacterized protein HG535_0E05670 [Zygotorulaspora mrakii]QLG73483.1 hypothetical protein HG535_0E05670 [Zygotorulaspora mrakii]
MLPAIRKNAIGQTQHLNQMVRTITYLVPGSRVRGLKREPSSYLKSPKGLSYQEIKVSEYHDRVRKSLQFDENEIDLPNEILLQCLTHKSFAHGSKPYNEKLGLLGSHFLKYQASIHSIKQPQLLSLVAPNKLQQAVNGLNFANLGTQVSKFLISKPAMAAFVKAKNIDSLVFWKMKDPLKDSHHNGETTIFSSVLNALVGAILLTNGPEKANRFVSNCLLGVDKDISLVKIANESFQSSNSGSNSTFTTEK